MVTKRAEEYRKTTVRVWAPLRRQFDEALDRLGLRRDAYLNRVLDVEVPELDHEVARANSAEARQFVAQKLQWLKPRELITLTLRANLIERLDRVCSRKRICRDAFFNRLLYLLTAKPALIDALFFESEARWRRDVWSECKHDGPFFRNVFYPLDPEVNPFWAIRAGLEVWAEQHLGPPEWEAEGIYRVLLFDHVSGKMTPLIGLSCQLDDTWVIGTEAAREAQREMQE